MHEAITRRRFLVRSAQAALVASAGVACAPAPRPEVPRLPRDLDPSKWKDLAGRLSGPVLRPGDPAFSRIATPNNLVFNTVFPSGIARCRNATPGSFQNFPDPSLTNPLDAYYGPNLGRLQTVKATFDRTCVFKYPQAIPPAGGCRA